MRFWRSLSTFGLSKNFQSKLDHYSEFSPTSLSIKQLLKIQENYNLVKSYQFLQREPLIRFANITKEMNKMAEHFERISSYEAIQSLYHRTFDELLAFEHAKYSSENMKKMTELLSESMRRHKTSKDLMAHACLEYKQRHGLTGHFKRKLNFFLDRFFLNRISVRMIILQHLAAYKNYLKDEDSAHSFKYIEKNCDVASLLMDAYETAKYITEQYYSYCPKMNLEINNINDCDARPLIAYVPTHLKFIATEILKNSIRAEIENENDSKLEPITAKIVKAEKYITIYLKDKGGGFPRSKTKEVFEYTYTTADNSLLDNWKCSTGLAPLAGYGYGLPLSRLYAQYFDGDIRLCSTEGVGTEAFIYLKALSEDANEKLPVYNESASSHYTSTQAASQWIYCHQATPTYLGIEQT